MLHHKPCTREHTDHEENFGPNTRIIKVSATHMGQNTHRTYLILMFEKNLYLGVKC